MDVCRRKKQKVSSVSSLFLVLHCTTMKSAFLSVWLSLFRNSKVTVYSLIYVTLWHMSICARIIISVALKQVDYAPDTKSGTERDNKGLQNGNCLIKKFHITSLSAAFCGGKNCLCWISGKKIAVVFSATAWGKGYAVYR